MKMIWYLIIGVLLYYSITILVTQKLPSIHTEGQLELNLLPSLIISAFFVYGAYIIWAEMLKK